MTSSHDHFHFLPLLKRLFFCCASRSFLLSIQLDCLMPNCNIFPSLDLKSVFALREISRELTPRNCFLWLKRLQFIHFLFSWDYAEQVNKARLKLATTNMSAALIYRHRRSRAALITFISPKSAFLALLSDTFSPLHSRHSTLKSRRRDDVHIEL